MDISDIPGVKTAANKVSNLPSGVKGIVEVAAPEAGIGIKAAEAINRSGAASKAAGGAMFGAAATAGSKIAGGVVSSGGIFIILAIVINLFVDRIFPFAGFNLLPYGIVSSVADIIPAFGGYWFTFRGPLLIILIGIVGNFVVDRDHQAFRLFLVTTIVFYTLSLLPSIIQGYFQLALSDIILFFIFVLKLLHDHPTREEFNSTVIFWVIVYSIFQISLATGNRGALIHLLLIVIFYFATARQYEQEKESFRSSFMILIFLDFFAVSLLSLLPEVGNFSWANLPILTIGVIMVVKSYETNVFSTIALAVIMFLAIAQIGVAYWSENASSIETIQGDASEKAKFLNPANIVDFWKKWTTEKVNQASGVQYTSEVDDNAKKKLGVYIEDLTQNKQRKYYEQEIVVIDATLIAETFGSEDTTTTEELRIEVGCGAYKNGKKEVDGTVWPNTQFTIYNYDSKNIQCTFEELPEGTYEIRFNAGFNFQTDSYLKRYFVLKERIDALRASKQIQRPIDILEQGQERNPQAQNSVGPIQIAASNGIPVIVEVDQERDVQQLFGVQLKNSWKGKIAQVNNIRFYIPEGLELQEERCSPLSMKLGTSDKEGYSLIELTEEAKQSKQLQKIDKTFDQRCWLKIPSTSADTVLQPGDVTTRFFLMQATYDYLLEEKVAITILKRPTLATT